MLSRAEGHLPIRASVHSTRAVEGFAFPPQEGTWVLG
jgi:hypothetical protein